MFKRVSGEHVDLSGWEGFDLPDGFVAALKSAAIQMAQEMLEASFCDDGVNMEHGKVDFCLFEKTRSDESHAEDDEDLIGYLGDPVAMLLRLPLDESGVGIDFEFSLRDIVSRFLEGAFPEGRRAIAVRTLAKEMRTFADEIEQASKED